MGKINGRDLLKRISPNIKIPKRRSKKVQMNLLKKRVLSMGNSLIHKDSFNSFPKGKHLWWWMPPTYPASFQTKAGKRMRGQIVQKLKNSNNVKRIHKKIGDKPIQILIKYLLVNTKKKRDVDNYTKNIIDSLREGGLFEDDTHQQVRFVASKINYIKTPNKKYYRALEKAIIIVDFFDETKGPIKEFDSNFQRE